MNSNLVEELKKLIEENLDPSMFPYAKGNSIRIGSLVIRENKKGFHIHDLKTKDHICSLVLNRPNELNTMTRDFWVELGDALEEINRDLRAGSGLCPSRITMIYRGETQIGSTGETIPISWLFSGYDDDLKLF